MTSPRPLGYWLTTVDRLLDDRFEQAAEASGVTPAGWQLLARLHTGAVAEDSVEALPHSRGDGDVLAELDRLANAGLAEHQGPEWRLTDKGHARVAEVEERADREIREQVGQAVSSEEYDALVATLERIARALGPQPT